MYAPPRSPVAVAVSDFATIGDDTGGPIRKVLVLNGDADSALAALLSDLEAVFDAPGVVLASNQRQALLDLRKATYGY